MQSKLYISFSFVKLGKLLIQPVNNKHIGIVIVKHMNDLIFDLLTLSVYVFQSFVFVADMLVGKERGNSLE